MTIDRLYVLMSSIPYIVNDDARCFSDESKQYILDNLEDIAMMAEAWKLKVSDSALESIESEEDEYYAETNMALAFVLRQLEVTHKALVANNQLDALKNNLNSTTIAENVFTYCGTTIHEAIIKTVCDKALKAKTPWSIKCNRVLSQLDKQIEQFDNEHPSYAELEEAYEIAFASNSTPEAIDKVLRMLR